MDVARQIHQALGEDFCDFFDLEDDYMDIEDMLEYDVLLFGCSTWGAGEVQYNWVEPLQDLMINKPDFSGKFIALFGAGDCVDHGEHFCSALGGVYDAFTKYGATFIAPFSTEGYRFKQSNAVRDQLFVGLPFDRVNEPEKTEGRLHRWLSTLKTELMDGSRVA